MREWRDCSPPSTDVVHYVHCAHRTCVCICGSLVQKVVACPNTKHCCSELVIIAYLFKYDTPALAALCCQFESDPKSKVGPLHSLQTSCGAGGCSSNSDESQPPQLALRSCELDVRARRSCPPPSWSTFWRVYQANSVTHLCWLAGSANSN